MPPAPRVLLVCCGLDHARRGYESFARECFRALRGQPGLELELVKSSGPSGLGEHRVPTFRRDKRVALTLGRALGFRPFRLEALAFGLALQPLLRRHRPDLVYLSEWDTARVLAALRRLTGQRFKLLLCNGGFASTGFEFLDHVQELTPAARDYVLERGADPSAHTVLPLGFEIPPRFESIGTAERSALRQKLRLPADRQILISVAALNRSHKRLDYLIDELAAVPPPRPFLLLVGEPDEETPGLRSLATARLGADGHEFRTVSAQEVTGLLRASDAFALTSLAEMQGRSVIEAMAEGLPCLVHDSPVLRFAVGGYGRLGDFQKAGSLTELVRRLGSEPDDPGGPQARHRHVSERFGWERLRPRYVELLRRVAG